MKCFKKTILLLFGVLLPLFSQATTNVWCTEYYDCSFANVSVSETDVVFCQGSHSCYQSRFDASSVRTDPTSNDKARIYCEGYYSCANSLVNTETNLYCYGENSCTNLLIMLDIKATFVSYENKIDCDGKFSCANANIQANNDYTTVVSGYTAYSLYNATISGNSQVYLHTYNAGYSLIVHCADGDSCQVSCDVVGGCHSTTIKCDYGSTCTVSCDNFNYYPINETNCFSMNSTVIDELDIYDRDNLNDSSEYCSIEFNDGYYDKYEISENDVYVFCSGFQTCYESTINGSSTQYSIIECSGYQSCRGSTIAHANKLYCDTYYSCYDSNIIQIKNIYLTSLSSVTNINSNGIGIMNVYCSNTDITSFYCDNNDVCNLYADSCAPTLVCYGNCTVYSTESNWDGTYYGNVQFIYNYNYPYDSTVVVISESEISVCPQSPSASTTLPPTLNPSISPAPSASSPISNPTVTPAKQTYTSLSPISAFTTPTEIPTDSTTTIPTSQRLYSTSQQLYPTWYGQIVEPTPVPIYDENIDEFSTTLVFVHESQDGSDNGVLESLVIIGIVLVGICVGGLYCAKRKHDNKKNRTNDRGDQRGASELLVSNLVSNSNQNNYNYDSARDNQTSIKNKLKKIKNKNGETKSSQLSNQYNQDVDDNSSDDDASNDFTGKKKQQEQEINIEIGSTMNL